MKRPGTDQAKLLFLYLLRSSAAAAWATETKAMYGATKAAASTPMVSKLVQDGHIQLRLARRTDVPMIQQCNLATLPENYHSQFYVNHLRQWPDLAIVAEHIPSRQTRPSYMDSFDPNKSPPNIVAYVLGKVDPVGEGKHNVGHVTSLAVLQEYRRRGLAAGLMDQLHHHLGARTKAVGLHVRVSNKAATMLYQNDGYEVADIISNYYQDGEDAYYMLKILAQPETEDSRERRWLARRRQVRPWEGGPLHYRLPRTLQQPHQDDDTLIYDEEEDEPQIMTGTF